MRLEIETKFAQSNALESRLKSIEKSIEDLKQEMDDTEKSQFSEKDRVWVRSGQIIGWLAFVIIVLSFIFTHVKVF